VSSKDDILKMFDSAIEAVLPKNAINNSLKLDNNSLIVLDKSYNLGSYKDIYLCGSGKASYLMAQEIEHILGNKIISGVVVSPIKNANLSFSSHYQSTHPIPTKKSIDASKMMLEELAKMCSEDLLIYCLSGGSSALLELPVDDITLDDFAKSTKILLENGFAIDEINSVRKHISLVKGGRLATSTKAEIIVLVISDVIGDDLESIASAPFYFDTSTFNDVFRLLKDKNVFGLLPLSVQGVIQGGLNGDIEETPKKLRADVNHAIISNNLSALKASASCASELGYDVKIVEKSIDGDVEVAARVFVKSAKELKSGQVIIQGGECTVNVTGSGIGGRNQHFLLTALRELDENITILSAGTDGIDGNSEDTGAVISLDTKKEANNLNLSINEYINNFNSNSFFKRLDSLISVGYTGTNVMDIMIAIRE